MNTSRSPRHSQLALSLLGVCLALLSSSSALALPTTQGSLQFDLTRPENADGTIDLFAALASRPQGFTQLRATFTVQVLGAFWGDAPLPTAYAPLSYERHDGGTARCAGSTQYRCLDELWVYERSLVTTMTQSESWLHASMGSASGRASSADVSPLLRVDDLGLRLDSSDTSHSLEAFSIDYDADGHVQQIRYLDHYQTQQYQTRSLVQWLDSPLGSLSVTLDLGATELAALSGDGLLHFNASYNMLSTAPTLRLDYTSVTAVPEPQTWLLFALGLAGLSFSAARRRRPASRKEA